MENLVLLATVAFFSGAAFLLFTANWPEDRATRFTWVNFVTGVAAVVLALSALATLLD